MLTPVGICYTPSSYGVYQSNEDMPDGSYMVTRDDDKQLTTYEIFFSWQDIYMEQNVPGQVFLNFQLHLADARYLDYVADGYIGCLGGLRYACRLSDAEKAELGTNNAMALHIFNLTDADRLNGKAPAETEAPSEEATEPTTEPITEAPTEAPTETPTEPATEAPTEAPTDAVTEAPTESPESGCSAVSMSAVAVLLAMAAAVALQKKA